MALFVILFVVYIAGTMFFSKNLYPNTTIAGKEASMMSLDALDEFSDNLLSDWKLSVTGLDFEFDTDTGKIDLSLKDRALFKDAVERSQNSCFWFAQIWGNHALFSDGVDVVFDEESLKTALHDTVESFNEEHESPKDAYAEYDSESKKYAVVPDVAGTKVSEDAVYAAINDAVHKQETELVLDDTCLLQPNVKADDTRLNDNCSKANLYLACLVPLTLDGNEVDKLTPDLISGWFSVGDEVKFDEDAVTAWARNDFSSKYDTVGTERNYTRPDGKNVNVPAGDGSYGWNVDGASLASELISHIENLDSSAVEIPFFTRGASLVKGSQDWSNRYIDVDLSEQYVRFYDNGNVIWEAPCVSGDTSNGHGTPAGVFFIEYKASPMVLVGLDEDHDGYPDYRTPVDYWMPFFNGCGLHDADWRGSFGGNIYTYDGSHGCVNLPYGSAQELYGISAEGDVVVVHW